MKEDPKDFGVRRRGAALHSASLSLRFGQWGGYWTVVPVGLPMPTCFSRCA